MILDVKDMREPVRVEIDEIKNGELFLYGGSLYYKVKPSTTDEVEYTLFNAICLVSGVLEWFDDKIKVEPCDIKIQIVES